MQLIEITPEEIILLKIEYAYIFYQNKKYMETLRFNYETQNVYYFVGEDAVEHWTKFNDFILKDWGLFKKEEPNIKLYIINEE